MTVKVAVKQKVKRLDLTRYNHQQFVDAMLCPVNRDMTRREHNCDDKALWENGGVWLMEHYIKFGGAEAWAKHRDEYEVETEVTVIKEIPVMVFLLEKVTPHLRTARILLVKVVQVGSALCHTAVK